MSGMGEDNSQYKMVDLAKVKKQLVGDDYIYDGCTVYYHVL